MIRFFPYTKQEKLAAKKAVILSMIRKLKETFDSETIKSLQEYQKKSVKIQVDKFIAAIRKANGAAESSIAVRDASSTFTREFNGDVEVYPQFYLYQLINTKDSIDRDSVSKLDLPKDAITYIFHHDYVFKNHPRDGLSLVENPSLIKYLKKYLANLTPRQYMRSVLGPCRENISNEDLSEEDITSLFDIPSVESKFDIYNPENMLDLIRHQSDTETKEEELLAAACFVLSILIMAVATTLYLMQIIGPICPIIIFSGLVLSRAIFLQFSNGYSEHGIGKWGKLVPDKENTRDSDPLYDKNQRVLADEEAFSEEELIRELPTYSFS
jgi:hypothetical protein